MNNLYIAVLMVGVAFLASGGIFVKLSELGPIATAFYRILIAMPLAFSWAVLSPAPRARSGVWNVPHGDGLLMAASGVFLALDLILWHLSFHHTTVANANLLANLVPFVVVPASWLLFGQRPSRLFLGGLFVAVAGVVLLMSGKINPSPDNFFGDFLATATAIFYGLYLLTVGKLREKYNAGDILFWGGFSALAVLFAAAAIWEDALLPTTMYGFLLLLCLAVFSHIGGQGLIAVSFGRLPIAFASVAVLMQPVIAAFYALLIFAEKLSLLEVAGAAVVLGGIFIAKLNSAPESQIATQTKERKAIERKLKRIFRGGSVRHTPKLDKCLLDFLIADLDAACSRNPAAHSRFAIIDFCPGFNAVCTYRLAHFLTVKIGTPSAQANAYRIAGNLLAYAGIDINPNAQIGQRFVLDHAHGIVIGETSIIGDDCYILGGTVLGSRQIADNKQGKRHPTVGNNVEIGMNARIFGDIKIGDNVVISPFAIVTKDVPSMSRVLIANQTQIVPLTDDKK